MVVCLPLARSSRTIWRMKSFFSGTAGADKAVTPGGGRCGRPDSGGGADSLPARRVGGRGETPLALKVRIPPTGAGQSVAKGETAHADRMDAGAWHGGGGGPGPGAGRRDIGRLRGRRGAPAAGLDGNPAGSHPG